MNTINTMLDRRQQTTGSSGKPRRGRRALFWFLVGVGVKLAITAIALFVFAYGDEAAAHPVIPIAQSL